MSAIKTTIIGGIFVLLPFAILLLLVQELLDFVMVLAEPIASLFSVSDIVGIALVNVIAWAIILACCFAAGVLARTAVFSGASGKVNEMLSQIVPGYRFIVARIEAAVGEGQHSDRRRDPVLVSVGGIKRFGFEMSRDTFTGTAIIFLPNVPDAETGAVAQVNVDHIDKLPMTTAELIRMLRFYGQPPAGKPTP